MLPKFNNKITWVFYTASVVIFILFVKLGIFILNTANTIADQADIENKTQLVQNEVLRQVELMARDQSQISNWDDTLKAVMGDLDVGFIRREIAGWLWEDFDIHDSIIVDPKGQPIVVVKRTKRLKPEAGNELVSRNKGLIKKTIDGYFENRIRRRNGYSYNTDPVREGTAIYAFKFVKEENQLVLFIAQSIVPSDGLVLPDGNPFVLLTKKRFGKELFEKIEQKLNVKSFDLVQVDSAFNQEFSTPIAGSQSLIAVWDTKLPSAIIWQKSKTMIISALIMLGGILLLFSWIYGQTLRKLEESEKLYGHLALHDPLTQLANRAKLEDVLRNLDEGDQHPYATIFCLDLDRFKPINDTWGHSAGDYVLKKVAERLTAVLGDKGIVARVGGDEFVVVVFELIDEERLMEFTNGISSSVTKPIKIDSSWVEVGLSIGVSRWSKNASSTKEAIRNADTALYQAKNSGRGRTEVIDFQEKKFQAEMKKNLGTDSVKKSA